ncbi:tRNA1(Val) (adenine(37)-N6)-methyltransferase [Aeromonas schubertii]|uniref:tRNA1(Val) (adenine(37)-N6)-methyltransferase n=1 Tax=Aeromonas schubertii TaxID=652 RepID=A0ABS7V9J6_9GAMM|nr:tRNA1(Val) (adenine(37)-N6)-methyltransferase [Aeromonas schubertii]MBZ6065688.1 tRNA1(Val) (adenine(37)-N6)-methyltransferase [Aeromonas schubertii]
MASPGFTFKQFHVAHDRCAMKVGTDGVLLGAWAPVAGARRILDIGSGTALVALMLAQRSAPESHIDAVEIDSAAAAQARENIASSPWPEKIHLHEGAIQTFDGGPFDLIVSNPPYFVNGQSFSDPARAQARHTGSLDQQDLLVACRRLLAPNGLVALVLPRMEGERLRDLAAQYDLHCVCNEVVITREGKEANRVLLLLSREFNQCKVGQIVIHSADGAYSDRYVQLASPFYLKM